MLKIFTRTGRGSRGKCNDENWVFASELNGLMEHEIEEGKTNLFIVGANIISDMVLLLPKDKFHVVVYRCRFKERKHD